MAKKAVTAEQSLESIMWNCRNALRGTVGGNEKNRDAVMGLVFLMFAGDKFDRRREAIKAQHGDVPAFLEKKSFYLLGCIVKGCFGNREKFYYFSTKLIG